MQIEVKEIEACKLSVHYEADASEILNKRGDVLNAFKKAPVSGFRPGKAPIEAIKMQYRTQIEDALKRALAEDAFHNTIFEKKLRPYGTPQFTSALLADGKFACDFELFTKPSFELVPYKQMEIPRPHVSHTAEQVSEMMLQELRTRFGDVAPYTEDDFVQKGDNVIVDYECLMDGQKVENLSAVGDMINVGNSHLPEFDDNLLGMKIGDTREFTMVVPPQGLPSMAGKTVQVKLTVNMGSKTIPCGLTDELAHKVGKKDYAELQEFVHTMAVSRVAQLAQVKLNEAVSNRLVYDNTINIPNWLALSEAQYLTHNAKLEWEKLSDEDKEKYIEMATKNVKLALVLDKIREDEPEAQLTDQETFEIVKSNLAQTQIKTSLDDMMKELNRTGHLQVLFANIRNEYALSFVVKSANVVD